MRIVRAVCAIGLAALVGCDDMSNQPRGKPYSAQTPPRDPPAGTVARTQQAEAVPALSAALLERGHERFDIYCAPCHGRVGDGSGMIVQRGFPQPPSFHTDRLRAAPTTHIYDVITSGYGAMYSYAARVPPRDRWAIAAYVRALQASQHASLADVPPAERARLRP